MVLLTNILLDDATMNSIDNGAYYVSVERKILLWNKIAEQVTGYMSNEVTGSHCFNDILMHQNDNGECICKTRCPLEATIRDGMVREDDLYFHHKKGQLVKVSVLTAPVYDLNNRLVGAVEIFREFPSKRNVRRSLKGLAGKRSIS